MLSFRRVNELPQYPDSDSLYFVRNGDIAETYLTDSAGVVYKVGNSGLLERFATEQIEGIIEQNLSGLTEVVPNISARNALPPVNFNRMVFVVDASGDNTVTNGSATYLWTAAGSFYTKIAEFESLDAQPRLQVLDGGNF